MDDSAFSVTCNECDTEQRLNEMGLSSVGDVTIYACHSCGHSLVGVKPFKEDAEPREGSGYRIKDNTVGNRVEMFMRPPGKSGAVLMPATPNFFQ